MIKFILLCSPRKPPERFLKQAFSHPVYELSRKKIRKTALLLKKNGSTVSAEFRNLFPAEIISVPAGYVKTQTYGSPAQSGLLNAGVPEPHLPAEDGTLREILSAPENKGFFTLLIIHLPGHRD